METRKVWAGYQRHQTWIDENEPVIAQLQQDINGLDTRLNSIQGKLTDVENTLTIIARQQRDLTDELNTTLRSTNVLLEELDASVKRHGDDIDDINDFRRQTNTSILDIRRRLQNLESDN